MGALTFATPALAFGALAVALPIAIHLLSRRRSKKLAFAAVDFLLRSKKQKTRHIRLRQLLLLAMRALIVGAIGFAIARPMLKAPSGAAAAPGAAAATAIVLDGSLSMQYRLDGRSLFARAQDDAKGIIDGLVAESPASLVVCDGSPPQVELPGYDRVGLKRKIDDAQPSMRGVELTGCLAAAAQSLSASPVEGKRLYVLTDLAASSLPQSAVAPKVTTPKGEVTPEIVFIDAAGGDELPNLSIADVALQQSPAIGTRGFEVAVTVRNSDRKPAENVAVSLRVGDRSVARGFIDVPAGTTARKILSHRFDPGVVHGSVSLDHDALEADDTRDFLLRVPRDVRALVVDGAPAAVKYRDEAFFIDAALGPSRTDGRIAATFLDADAAATRTLSDFDVVLLLNAPAPRPAFVAALRSFVEAGGGLFISAGDQVVPDDYNAALGDLLPRPMHLVRTAADPEAGASGTTPPARFVRVDMAHPAFAIFQGASEGFDTARTYRYVLLQPDPAKSERILASFDDGSPALIEAQRGQGKVILFTATVDRDWSDWPLRTSFLPAIQQLSAYLAGGLDEKPPAPFLVGETVKPELPAGTQLASVRGPEGDALTLAESGVVALQPGLHSVQVRDAGGLHDEPRGSFVVVIDANEGDTLKRSAADLDAQFGTEGHSAVATSADAARPNQGTPLWTWLLVAALIAFFVEGLLVRRA